MKFNIAVQNDEGEIDITNGCYFSSSSLRHPNGKSFDVLEIFKDNKIIYRILEPEISFSPGESLITGILSDDKNVLCDRGFVKFYSVDGKGQ